MRRSLFKEEITARMFSCEFCEIQKQLLEMFCKKKLFLKCRNIHSNRPVLESLLNKVAGLRLY